MIIRLYILILLLAFAGSDLMGQGRKRRKPSKPASANEQFLQTQFWIGFKGGINLSQANPEQSFSTFAALDFPEADLVKTYNDFEDVGTQFGLEFIFYHKGFSLSLYPNYSRFNFSYSNFYEYSSIASPDLVLTLDYQQKVQLEYLDFPVVLKYDILKGDLRPFVQLGFYYSSLVDANKEVNVSGTDFASGGEDPFQRPALIVGAEDLFINSSTGLIGGIGLNYDQWNVRFMLDINYRYGFNNITSVENRYSDNRLAGSGDALDDLTLDNLTFNMGVLFPLRFISKNFSSN